GDVRARAALARTRRRRELRASGRRAHAAVSAISRATGVALVAVGRAQEEPGGGRARPRPPRHRRRRRERRLLRRNARTAAVGAGARRGLPGIRVGRKRAPRPHLTLLETRRRSLHMMPPGMSTIDPLE